MTAAGRRDATGVGLCLGTTGAVLAVVRQYPMRLAAVATVTWPAQLWRPDPTPAAMSAGRRVLARARRQLGLPRYCPVAVVAGPSLSAAGTPDWVPVLGAQLLARAALVQGWTIAPNQAAALLRAATHLAVTAELAVALAGTDPELAVGAAIAALPPADPGWGGPDPVPAGAVQSILDNSGTEGEPPRTGTAETGIEVATGGWAVQPIGGSTGAPANGPAWW
jgi:hypothetical protein